MLSYQLAAVCTFFYIVLSFYVIFLRKTNNISLGSKGNEALEIGIRVHSNYIEYTLLFIILFYFAELKGGESIWLFLLGAIFLTARILHSFGLIYKHIPIRMIAMIGTLGCLINLALFLI